VANKVDSREVKAVSEVHKDSKEALAVSRVASKALVNKADREDLVVHREVKGSLVDNKEAKVASEDLKANKGDLEASKEDLVAHKAVKEDIGAQLQLLHSGEALSSLLQKTIGSKNQLTEFT